ncbi:ATP-binding protein [Streptomyces lunaelactis]|nr:ATP-binding protein [Streptomyces lunaelactis]NUK44872.1 ATP-binding protein [Streptomyces lunaelactis]NUK54158.1 ATP-binding protein [Streptomyces lunaelactis]NUK61101.1 ATP-binding protein [Streptomyces lunaelactis]NUK67844.1 ATP-binding protein [Streptomyces lunaelactis]
MSSHLRRDPDQRRPALCVTPDNPDSTPPSLDNHAAYRQRSCSGYARSATLSDVNHQTVSTELPVPTHRFTVRLSATRRGARLARRLATQQLDTWGWPYDSDSSQTAALLVAELAANAITHGRVPGRDFRLGLTVTPPGTLRVEVSDARRDRGLPATADLGSAPLDSDGGRGLLLVDALAADWGTGHSDPVLKTVWCSIALGPSVTRARRVTGPSPT